MISSAARSPEHPLLHQLSLHRALRARLDPQGLVRREAHHTAEAEAEAQTKGKFGVRGASTTCTSFSLFRFLKVRVAWMTVGAMVTKSQIGQGGRGRRRKRRATKEVLALNTRLG